MVKEHQLPPVPHALETLGAREVSELTAFGHSKLEIIASSESLGCVDSPRSDAAHWLAHELAPHESALRAYLHGIVAPDEIDDIVQETYVRVLRARDRGPITSPRGLLFATARNAARNLSRKNRGVEILPITEFIASRVFDGAPGVAEIVSRRQEAALLKAAIAALPPRCREILVLRKFENLSHREISVRLGIAEHTVEAQLTQALHRFEAFFSKHGDLPK